MNPQKTQLLLRAAALILLTRPVGTKTVGEMILRSALKPRTPRPQVYLPPVKTAEVERG